MTLSKQLSLFSVAVLLCSSFASTVSAEYVTFEFKGRTQATIVDTVNNSRTFFPEIDFTIATTIDSRTPDEFPFQNGRGGFVGATTTLSIPDAGIFDAQVTNVTGILQEGFGNFSRLNLVDSDNLFGQSALGVDFNQPIFIDPNSLNPLIDPLSPSNAQGGLPLQLLAGPDVIFNSVREVAVSSNAAIVANPEPTSFTLCGIGLLAVAFKRRRRSRR